MPVKPSGDDGGTARAVLAQLADGATHSGERLAERLGVTRAAVWKQIRQLREAGLPLDAVAGRGYCLPWPLELLDRERIQAALPASIRAGLGTLEVLWRPGSTSDVARDRLADDPSAPCAILAECQRAGRGRRGRPWLSPPGLNLYLSLGLRFDTGAMGLAGLSLAVGVMLLRALEDAGCNGVQLKWPNDLVADGAKLAGVLLEIEGEYGGPSDVVIGIGLNLRMPAALRTAAGQPVTDLATLMEGAMPARNLLAARVLTRLIEGTRQFAAHGYAAFADEYARHDALIGRPLRIHAAHGDWQGTGTGIDARGALKVRTAQGVVAVDSAEVSVRRA